jgi:nicotinamide-nucleotide amidase
MEAGQPGMTERPDGLAAQVHELLLAKSETVGTAESMTAGMLGAALTTTPGASLTYRGGLIVYATDLKASLAGVSLPLLEERGPVDPDVAAQLATGARERVGATWGVGLTGVAGPDPQDGQPVGRLYLGVAGPSGAPEVVAATLSGDRGRIRSEAVALALTTLRDRLAARE